MKVRVDDLFEKMGVHNTHTIGLVQLLLNEQENRDRDHDTVCTDQTHLKHKRGQDFAIQTD